MLCYTKVVTATLAAAFWTTSCATRKLQMLLMDYDGLYMTLHFANCICKYTYTYTHFDTR